MTGNYRTCGVPGNCGALSTAAVYTSSPYGTTLSLEQVVNGFSRTKRGGFNSLHFLGLGADTIAKAKELEIFSGKHCVYCDGVLAVPPDNWPGKREWIVPKHGAGVVPEHRPRSNSSHGDLTRFFCSVYGPLPEKATLEDMLTGLNFKDSKVHHYSGAFITRRPFIDGVKKDTGAFAARLRYLMAEVHNAEKNEPERWYATGVEDIHVAFPVPLHRNSSYVNSRPHSGDSFSMMFYQGKEPPPILTGGFITVRRRLRRLFKS